MLHKYLLWISQQYEKDIFIIIAYINPHFPDEEIEAKRDKIGFPQIT